MNTGFIQVKYQILKQWPIVITDLSSDADLIDFDISLKIKSAETARSDSLDDQNHRTAVASFGADLHSSYREARSPKLEVFDSSLR